LIYLKKSVSYNERIKCGFWSQDFEWYPAKINSSFSAFACTCTTCKTCSMVGCYKKNSKHFFRRLL